MRKRETSGIAIVVGLLLAQALSSSPLQAAGRERAESSWHSAYSWRQTEGLPQDSVLTLLQTQDGYIWVGTKGGLSRFDGVRFTNFGDGDKSQLKDNEVWALVEGDDSSLWIGTYGGGLSRLKEGRFTTFTTGDGLVNDFVRVLCRDASGAIWIGTDRGLSRFKDGRFTNLTVRDGLANDKVSALRTDSDGSVLVGTDAGGLYRFMNERLAAVTLPEPRPTTTVADVLRDRRGALWIGTHDGLYRWAGGAMKRYTTTDGLSLSRIGKLHEDPAGRLWIASDRGLDRFDAGESGSRPIRTEVPGFVAAVLADREGGLWVGSRTEGLSLFREGPFENYAIADGLPSGYISAVLQDGYGTVWMGTLQGLAALRPDGVTAYAGESGLPSEHVTALTTDADGHLWVGTEKGIGRSRSGADGPDPRGEPRFQTVPIGPVPSAYIRVFHQDRKGVMWIGTDRDGLIGVQAGRVIAALTTRDGLSHNAVRALAEDRDGGLWIGTKGGGLDLLVEGKLTNYGRKDGLPSLSVQALYNDPENTLWIATRQGLVRRKDGRFTTYTAADGLFSSYVHGFVEHDRDLWMTCTKGIFRVSKHQLAEFADGKIQSLVSLAYGREHGLRSTVGTAGHSPAGWKARDGRLWFGTTDGAAVIDPRALSVNRVAPPVHIEDVGIDERGFAADRAAEAPAGRGDFVLRYTALSYVAPDKVRFKYKLEGFDTDWTDAGTRRVAYYTNMPPGRYTFKVIAGNNDGVWNEAGASIDIRLRPHFYQTSWFYAGCALGVALAGAATQRLRVKRLEARERELSSRVEEAVAQIKVLRGLLPICASCKKIRDDGGYWSQMEAYIHEHSEAEFSHGICPDCVGELYPAFTQRAASGQGPGVPSDRTQAASGA